MLSAMADAGLVEQHGDARLYRLGPGILRFARVREATCPVGEVYRAALDILAIETGETTYAALISGRALVTIGVCESKRNSRVSLIAGEILSFHSTASGLSALAYASEGLRRRILSAPLPARTPHTITDAGILKERLKTVRAGGFAEVDQTHEKDVYSIAAPVFDANGIAAGTVSVVAPAHRITAKLRATAIRALLRTSAMVTFDTRGRVPVRFDRARARTLDALEA